MQLKKPKAILFDWDNTLVDNWAVISHVINETLRAMGHNEWSKEEGHRNIRRTAAELFPELFGDRAGEAQKIFYDAFEKDHLNHLTIMDGAEDFLYRVKAENIQLAVVSNKKGEYLRREADFLGWQNYFDILIGAGDCPKGKPAPEPAFLALETMKIEPNPHHVWVIGDTDVDIEMANNAGLQAIYLDTERMRPTYHRVQSQPHVKIGGFAELFDALGVKAA